MLTVVLYIVIPKGFFPVQDTGLIQAVTEAPQIVSFDAMAERQQALADGDPARIPTSRACRSFIGVDGTNTDAQHRPHADQPQAARAQRSRRPARSSAASSARPASVPGITLYMQPAQDLTIDSTVSRTQYQFVAGRAPTRATSTSGCRA